MEGDLSPSTEAILAKIWADVFRRKEVGSEEGFSELGGDSISAAVIITRIYEAFGIELQFADLFRAQTITKLSERIDAARAEQR